MKLTISTTTRRPTYNLMSTLTDIAIEHTYKGKKSSVPLTFILHPFENSIGAHAGRFEVVRDISADGKKRKRSAHLTKHELAEMYARQLDQQFDVRLRLRPARGNYPDSPPGKKVPRACIAPGSEFEKLVLGVDPSRPISHGLREQLRKIGVV